MSSNFKAVKVTDSVYWVGAVDWGVRYFHGYSTKSGTTYNAFLIMADKITLIDGVKHGFEKELLERVASVVDPQRIDYIISNHSEPDHSGTIPEIIKAVKPQKVFASKNGVRHSNHILVTWVLRSRLLMMAVNFRLATER